MPSSSTGSEFTDRSFSDRSDRSDFSDRSDRSDFSDDVTVVESICSHHKKHHHKKHHHRHHHHKKHDCDRDDPCKDETICFKVKHGRDGRDGCDGRDGERGPRGPRGPKGKDGCDGHHGCDGCDLSNNVIVAGCFFYVLKDDTLLRVNKHRKVETTVKLDKCFDFRGMALDLDEIILTATKRDDRDKKADCRDIYVGSFNVKSDHVERPKKLH